MLTALRLSQPKNQPIVLEKTKAKSKKLIKSNQDRIKDCSIYSVEAFIKLGIGL